MEEEVRLRLPDRNADEVLGVITEALGWSHFRVYCEDGVERVCRVPGRIRRRIIFRPGNYVIVKVWSYSRNKGDLIHKYSPTEVERLREMGLLKPLEEYA